MHKPFAKKLLLIVGTLALALTAFIAGGILMPSAQAASTHSLDQHTTQSKCDTKNPPCKGERPRSSTNQVKGIVTINKVSGNTLQATVVEPSEKKGSTVTIITSSSTIYKPDSSVVAVGKTIFVFGTVNSDGSITAQGIAFFDPTVTNFGGVVTRIDGSTITVRVKDNTHTIVVTTNTTFLKAYPATKKIQPASQSDLKVGELIKARGKLNGDGSLTAEAVLIAQAESNTKENSGSIQ